MKPAIFEYRAPATVDEAVPLLEMGGPKVRVLAGDQSTFAVLCRCTGYQNIVKAVIAAAQFMRKERT